MANLESLEEHLMMELRELPMMSNVPMQGPER
jgi:hypothetical protein